MKKILGVIIILMLLFSVNTLAYKANETTKNNNRFFKDIEEKNNKLTIKLVGNRETNNEMKDDDELFKSNLEERGIKLYTSSYVNNFNNQGCFILNSPGFQQKILESYTLYIPENELKSDSENTVIFKDDENENNVIISSSDTTSPPWDDNWHDTYTHSDCGPPQCLQFSQASSDEYEGNGYVEAARGKSGDTNCKSWFGFQGHWECPSTGEWDVIFQITYSGTVSARNIPSLIGDSSMEIGCKVVYHMDTLETKETILWYRDTWEYTGSWGFGDTIGLIYDDVTLTGGFIYNFTVEFQLWINITVTGYERIHGSIGLDAGSFDEAMFPLVPKPDLYINEYTLWTYPSPGLFWPGDTVKLLGNVMNIGVASAESFTVGVKFDDNLIETIYVNELPPLHYIELTVENYMWPDDTEWHKITWIADYNDEIDELYGDNNEGDIWIRARKKPDMTITKAWATNIDLEEVDENIYIGQPIIFWANISNLGDIATPFWITMYMDDEIFAEGAIPGWGSNSYGWVYTDPAWNWEGGEHEIRWLVDSYNDLDESNENNNNRTKVIGPPEFNPDLKIGEKWSEPENFNFKPGDDVHIFAEVLNNGNSHTGSFKIGIKVDNQPPQKMQIEPGIPPSGKITLDVKFTDGWPDYHCHTFTFISDIDNEVTEKDENNNEGEITVCPGPHLDCEGELRWSNVQAKEEVTGSFKVKNIGGEGSKLDWKISSYPSWGTWSFDPSNGNDLTGEKTVKVTVTAPNSRGKTYTGKIIVVNKEDDNNRDEVTVELRTSRTRMIKYLPCLFHQLSEKHLPIFKLVEKYIIGWGLK